MPEIIQSYCNIENGKVYSNGLQILSFDESASLSETLKIIYKDLAPDYAKFFKMDNLCKLGFLAGEVLLSHAQLTPEQKRDAGIFLCNSTASLDTDMVHQQSISDQRNYLPSPSIFVYTLPNILIGELAIRHKIKGENTFLIFDKFEAGLTQQYASLLLNSYGLEHLLIGWVDVLKEDYRAFMLLVSKTNETHLKNPAFNLENLNKAYLNELV